MKNRNIIIIGGTDGIGRALANKLVEENAVLIIGRSEHKAKSFVEANAANAKYLTADLSILNNVPPLVDQIKTIFDSVDFIVHTADVLRVKRIDTVEGLEVSIATNYYARVLFNQLMIHDVPELRPERIIHVALAGYSPPKNFVNQFPLPETANGFKAHALGQVANDFYALFIRPKLENLGVKINVLNPGTVGTNIRRGGQFPRFIKSLIPIVERLMKNRIQAPEDYAEIPFRITRNNNPEANQFTLISPQGKGLIGNANINDVQTQRKLYDFTTGEIDRILQTKTITGWL